MNVRFHTAMFDHENFHSAKVIGNQVHLYHTADEDVVKFKNKEEAEAGLIELDKIIFHAENGTYVPEGLSNKDKAEAIVEKAISQLDDVISKVTNKAKEAIVDSAVSKAKSKVKGSIAAGMLNLAKMQSNIQAKVQEKIDSGEVPTPTEILDRLMNKVQDTKQNVNVLPPEDFLRKLGVSDDEVNELLGMIFGESHEEEEEGESEPKSRITRDIPVTRAGSRKSLLDDADVFGTSRNIEVPKVEPVQTNIIPEVEWDNYIGSFSDAELRATLKHEISISASTEKVRRMFESQGMDDKELEDMLKDYLEIIMEAARENPRETLRDLIVQLLN